MEAVDTSEYRKFIKEIKEKEYRRGVQDGKEDILDTLRRKFGVEIDVDGDDLTIKIHKHYSSGPISEMIFNGGE